MLPYIVLFCSMLLTILAVVIAVMVTGEPTRQRRSALLGLFVVLSVVTFGASSKFQYDKAADNRQLMESVGNAEKQAVAARLEAEGVADAERKARLQVEQLLRQQSSLKAQVEMANRGLNELDRLIGKDVGSVEKPVYDLIHTIGGKTLKVERKQITAVSLAQGQRTLNRFLCRAYGC